MDHDYIAESILLQSRHDSSIADEKQDAVQQWAETWAEYFRQDETRVDSEIQNLCNRLRALATSLES